jgi:hypothetical protein
MKNHPVCFVHSFNVATRIFRSSSIRLLLAAISLLLLQSAHATLYLSEPFDYPPGQLTNAVPWSTNGTSGDASLQLVSGDLYYPVLTDPAPVNHTRLQWSSNQKGERGIPGGPLGGPGSGVIVYASFILYEMTTNGTTASTPIVGVCVNSTETINQGVSQGPVLYYQQSGGVGFYHLGIKTTAAGTTVITYPSGTQVYAAGNTSTGTFGQTNFVVMKYTFSNPAGSDTVQLWVNPDTSSFGGSEPAATTNDVAATIITGAATAGLDYFQIRAASAGGAAGTLQMDDVLIGTTWADVTLTCVTAGTTVPANQSVSPGQTATFSVTATGSSPTFQWQTNNGSGWVNIGGATSTSYTTPPEVLADNGLQFRCIVNVACDNSSVTSAAATLTVQTCVPAGTSNPTNQSVDVGDTAAFSVTGSGTSPTYQWQTNNGGGWVNIGGVTTSSYTTSVQTNTANTGLQFRCIVSVACNGGSSTNSAAATLTVNCSTAGVTNPQNQTVVAGQTATFSVVGSGSHPTYQWATNNENSGGSGGWFDIIGATNSSYTTPPEVVGDYGLEFQCTVSVACDSSTAISQLATLKVNCFTAGTTDPANKIVGAGQTATFSVTGSGSNPTYQWQTNNGSGWVNIGGATSASYTTPVQVNTANNGLQFRCIVTTPCDSASATSAAATLGVYPGNAIFWSISSGNISDPNIWEASYDGGITWTSPALYAPTDVNSTNITVRSGHNVVNSVNWQLDQVVVQAGGQITINTNTTLTIADGPGTDLDIFGTNDVTGTLKINASATVVVESGGVLINEQGGTETTTGTLTFNSGGTYQHNYATAAGTIPTATWNTGSSCQIIGYTSDSLTLAGANQSFYNFVWNCPNQTNQVPLGGSIPTTVNGDFTVISTGTGAGEIRLSNNNSPTSNITGNLNLQGGKLTLASPGKGMVKLYVSGNVLISPGAILNNFTNQAGTNFGVIHFAKGAGTQTFTNGGSITGPINWVVDSGSTLYGGTSVLESNLTLAAGGQIRVTTNTPLFTVSGNLTNNNNTVVIDLGGIVGPGSYPLFNYTGNRHGSLNPTPQFVSGGVSGGTAVIDASTPGQIRLTVVNPRTSRIVGFGLSGTTLTISGTNGTLGGSYGILASTNVALALAQWTPVYLSGLFDGSGDFSASFDLTNTLSPNAPQQFFMLESPTP